MSQVSSIKVIGDYGVTKKNEKHFGLESRVFPKTFLLLMLGGLWSPTAIKSRALIVCYQSVVILSYVSVVTLIAMMTIDSIFSDQKAMTSILESSYLIIVFTNGLMRMLNLSYRRDMILHLLRNNILSDRWQSLRNDEEVVIIEKCKISEILVLKIWGSIIFFNGISSWFNPLIHDNPNNTLILESYSPCDRSIPWCFWILYLHQLSAYLILSFAHVGVDCLIYNFIDRINAHMKIFVNRLLTLPARVKEKTVDDHKLTALNFESDYIRECVEDHHSIYKSIDELNRIFNELASIQFLSCIIILCTNIYFLSKQELFSPPFIAVTAFLCCALTQNFFFCLYGHKLPESNSKIVDAIFGMEWQVLQKETKRKLLFIMLLASKEITLFNNAFVNLSPETFLKLLKVSYSAFNLLNQSTNK